MHFASVSSEQLNQTSYAGQLARGPLWPCEEEGHINLNQLRWWRWIYPHTHTYYRCVREKKRKKKKSRQGEVKVINVSELVMHHTSVLIDRWHQESVPFLFNPIHTTHTTHTKCGSSSRTKTNFCPRRQNTKQRDKVYLLVPQPLRFFPFWSAEWNKATFPKQTKSFPIQIEWRESGRVGLVSLTHLMHIWYVSC